MSSDPWLSGLLACALAADADAVRQALHARGLKTRSVPAGRAKGAWTCVTDRGTLAVVTTGRGAEATRQAASFWMPRARWLVLAGAGPGTSLATQGTVLLDGDAELRALATRAANQAQPPITTTAGRVAAVPDAVLGPAARDTLAASGYAAWDPNVDAWRRAASAIGGVTLVCQGITTTAPDREHDLHQDVPEGATGRPWWRTTLQSMLPSQRQQSQQADRRHREAVSKAARCAVAALLGPA